MKIPERRKNKKPLIITLVALVLFALAAFGVWYFFMRPQPSTNQGGYVNYNPPTTEEKQETEQQKEQIIKEQENPPQIDANLTATITSVFQDPNGINVRAIISGTNNGECVVTLSKDGHSNIVKTFAIAFEATSASCQGATIPLGEVPADGQWNISVIIKKDIKQSEPTTATVNVTK